MKLTIAEAHRLNVAFTAIARGFPNGDGALKPAVVRAGAKLTLARNLRRLREVLQPAEEEMVRERDRLLGEHKVADVKALPPEATARLGEFIREMNSESCEVPVEPLWIADLDLDHFNGHEAIEALCVLDPLLLEDPKVVESPETTTA